ncbi:MAG: diguanylate cyclase (GGDEF)-like protein/PAS domain S-box-containing protein [Oceanicoccus sp.]
MLIPINSMSKRRYLYALALVFWLLVISCLFIRSFEAEKQAVYNQLDFKTEIAFLQFERHWPDLSQQSLAVKNHYLAQLTFNFKPILHFSAIRLNGEVLASSLKHLNQLSYGPIIDQFQTQLELGQSCLTELFGLFEVGVLACAYSYNDELLLIASAHPTDILFYWFSKDINFIIISLLSIGLLLLLLFLNYKQKKGAILDYEDLEKSILKQGSDFKRLVSNLPGILYRLNLQEHTLDYISPGSFQLLGYAPDYFSHHGTTPFDLIDEDDKHDFTKNIKSAHFSLKPFEMVYRIKAASGEHKWILDRGRCYQDENEEYFIEGVMLDITEHELVRQQIEYLGIKDPLTELYNRFKFNDELVQAVNHAKQSGEHFAMLFIDLDRFKNINDSLGHQLGDRLLQKVAQRLQSILPREHFLARMGGDEFVILMRNVEKTSDIEVFASDINRHLRQVFRVDSYELRTSCSIGISLCPSHSEHSHILWRYADTAMYQVKNRGGDGFQFFTQEMGDMVQHRINIEHSFMPAFDDQQFELFYQPQVDIHTNEILGCEALIRWFHPELGAISPAEFIPIAEETGFIHTLGDWILEQSLLQLKEWLLYNPKFVMSVNVSALQVTEDFPKKVKQLLTKYDIDGASIELEITETLLMENIDFILPLLNEIKESGVGFAIDDFGTGYSSLSYLRYLPIKKLKIDRAFIMNIENNNDDKNMVKAIIAMSKSMNLIVLAEGIENQVQLNLLRELLCERYQGYFFNKPLDRSTFTSLYFEPKKTG